MIYLFQSGAPAQMDLFDYKPALQERRAQQLPDSVRKGQRLTGMTATQDSLPVAPSIFKFNQNGQSGAWVSEIMSHTAKVADELCFIRTMHTEAINHDPAITFFPDRRPVGRPSQHRSLALLWAGKSEPGLAHFCGHDLARVPASPTASPSTIVLWGSGFLPTRYQGVKFRSVGDPVLYLSNPRGTLAPPAAAASWMTSPASTS